MEYSGNVYTTKLLYFGVTILLWGQGKTMPYSPVMESKNISNNGENHNMATPSEDISPLETVWPIKGRYPLPMNILTGMLLGDAGIAKYGKETWNAYIYIRHGEKQKEYLLHKAEILQQLTKVRIRHSDNGSGSLRWNAESLTHPFYTKLHKRWYKNGKKIITEKNIEFLDAIGLAYWYMDDGSLLIHYRKNQLSPRGREMVLCTHGFTKEENEILKNFLQEKFDINMRVATTRGYYYLKCGIIEGKKLIAYVQPHIIPLMKYKIDLKYRPRTRYSSKEDDDTVRPAHIDKSVECDRNDRALSLDRVTNVMVPTKPGG